MARALPSKVAFVLHAIAFTTAIALTSDYFQLTASLGNPLPTVFLSRLPLPFPGTVETYPIRE